MHRPEIFNEKARGSRNMDFFSNTGIEQTSHLPHTMSSESIHPSSLTANLNRRHDFPTPLSPMRTSLKR
jgi:hypothetical protein